MSAASPCVILFQVHNRLEYLRHLIVSLAQARDIDSVLLVFSHDYYDEDINQLITTIDFCKVSVTTTMFTNHCLSLAADVDLWAKGRGDHY